MKILILNDEQNQLEKILKTIKISNIEIMDASLEEVKTFKNTINKNNDILNNIKKILKLLGVPDDKIGYKYIIEAILLWNEYKEKNNLHIIYIYQKIAMRYNKSIFSVEKAIRTSIEYTFSFGNLKELNKIFKTSISIHTGKVSNKKFILKLSDHVNEKK